MKKLVIDVQGRVAELKHFLETRTYQAHRRVEDGDRGASMVEYGILVGLIAVVAIVAIGLVGNRVNNTFQNVANTLPGG